VGDYGSSRPNGASFSGLVADCNDEIELNILKFVHGLAAGIGGIYLEVVPKYREGNRMGCGLRIDSGAKHLKSVSARLAE
jgi:hypothetical protein